MTSLHGFAVKNDSAEPERWRRRRRRWQRKYELKLDAYKQLLLCTLIQFFLFSFFSPSLGRTLVRSFSVSIKLKQCWRCFVLFQSHPPIRPIQLYRQNKQQDVVQHRYRVQIAHIVFSRPHNVKSLATAQKQTKFVCFRLLLFTLTVVQCRSVNH